MAANFTWNITVGANGTINATGPQDLDNGFRSNNASGTNSLFTFSSPTVIGTVAIATTEVSFSYQYGWYNYDPNTFSYYAVINVGTANRTTDIAMSGSSDTLRALAAGQTRDVTVTYVFYPQYSYDSYPSSFGIETGGTSGQATFHFIGVNDAPILNDTARALFSVQEDAAAPSGFVGTSVSSFLGPFSGGFTEYDNVLTSTVGIAVTGLDSANGTWWYSINNGSSWLTFGSVSESSARLLASDARVYFKPNANFNGTLDNAITFRAWDQTTGTNGGTANTTSNGGTTAFSSTTDTASLTVQAVNDAPSVGAVSTLTYAENQTATLLAPSATVTDIDSPNFNSGFLKVSFTASGTAADQLSIVTDEHVSVTGNVVSIDGTEIGTLTSSGANGAALQVNLNSAATPALVQVLMRHIAYENTSDNPSTTARSVKFEVMDGNATGSTTSTINIAATNDEPVINTVTFDVSEGGTTVLGAANFSITDPDNTSQTYTVSGVTHGVFQTSTDGSVWVDATTFTTAAVAAGHVRFVHDGGEAAPTFSIQANDGATANNVSGVVAGTVSFTPVNDAPFMPAVLAIDFEDIPHPLDGGFTPLASYTTNGFVFSSTHGGTDAFESFHMGHVFYPGSAALANSYAGALTTLQRSDGSVFDMDRIDLDSFLLGSSSQVTFTGTLAGGGTVQQTLNIDGLRGFQTFSLSSDFDHVVSVAWDQVTPYNVFDNVRLNLSPVFPTLTDEETDNAGQTVASLLKNIADPDAGALEGIAITAAVNGNGHWEYSTGGGWTAFDAVSDSHALLLRASDVVRFVPNGVNSTNASFEFHAWDQSGVTAGQEGTYADLTTLGTGGSARVQHGHAIRVDHRHRRQRSADGRGDHHRNGGRERDAYRFQHACRRRRPGHLQLPVAAQRRQHRRRDGLHPRARRCRCRRLDPRDRLVHRRQRHGREPDQRGGRRRWPMSTMHPRVVTVVTGTPTEDQTLTANTGAIADADGLGAFSYQWQRNGVNIAGATGSTHALGDADVGASIRVIVSYTDGNGTAESLTSAAVGPVANVNDAPTGAPVVTGTPTEDQTLTANTGAIADADGLGAFSYQWQRNGVNIAGATGSTHALGDADVGTSIRVIVSLHRRQRHRREPDQRRGRAGGQRQRCTHRRVPVVTGTATEDQTLTANTGAIADADGLGTFSYQWQRNGVNVAGATGAHLCARRRRRRCLDSRDRLATPTATARAESLTSAAVGPVANVNDAPTGAPVVTGTPTEDQTLTANTGAIADADGLGTFTYQWQRNGVNIAGATGSTYALGDADVGASIRVIVSYTDSNGTAESLTSAAVGPVANVNDAPTGAPVVTGTPTEDQTLTANTGAIADADGLGTFSYQWQRNGVNIAGATGSTYALGDADVGASIRVIVSYTDGNGTAESLTSAAVGPVANVNDAPTGAPVVTGTPTEDQTLTANTGAIADADGLGTFSYQWQRNGVNVAGATGSTYALGDADVGASIRVIVSYTDGNGTAESLTSAAVGPVANVNDAPTGAPVVTGTPTEDQTLTANTGAIADADGLGTFSYQWQRNGVNIAGATGSTHALGDADVGASIRVIVSYTDGNGTAESLTSAAVGPVANVNDAPTGAPVVTGTPTEDQTLTANTGAIADADGLGAFSYQWQRNGTHRRRDGSTYALGDADVGASITVKAAYVDGHGTTELVTSAATGTVLNVNDAPAFTATSPALPGITEDAVQRRPDRRFICQRGNQRTPIRPRQRDRGHRPHRWQWPLGVQAHDGGDWVALGSVSMRRRCCCVRTISFASFPTRRTAPPAR